MKIISSLRTGFGRVFRAWNAVVITWFLFFLLTVLLVFPLRSALNNTLGSSMITERLAEGLDIEVFADLGDTGKSLLSFFASGFFYTFVVAFLLNAFISAGLFGIMRKDSAGFSSGDFFRAAGRNFLSFLLILFILTIVFGLSVILLVIVPLGASGIGDGGSPGAIQLAAVILLILLSPVFLLVADYSRARKASREDVSAFEAIGYGLSRTFGNFGRSYLLMVLLVLAQIVLLAAMFLIMPVWRPSTGAGVLLMLVVSQLLVFLRLFLKAWRYAGVTSMMENLEPARPEAPQSKTTGSAAGGFSQNMEKLT